MTNQAVIDFLRKKKKLQFAPGKKYQYSNSGYAILASIVEREAKLNEERTELQEYQKKLDDARTRVKEGDLTESELDRMDKDLEKSMPKAVRDIVQRNDGQHQQIGKETPSQETEELSPDSPPKSDRRGSLASPQGPGRG